MEQKDKKRFQAAMVKTKVALPGPNLSVEELVIRDQVFWEALAPYSIGAVEIALQEARSSLKFFPVPAQIIAMIVGRANREWKDPTSKIEWSGQTREAKEKLKAILSSLYQKWDIEDEEEIRQREARFQKRRQELLKQAEKLR